MQTTIDQGLAKNLHLKVAANSLLVVTGSRVFDRMLSKEGDVYKVVTLDSILHNASQAVATFVYEPAVKQLTLKYLCSGYSITGEVPKILGEHSQCNVDTLMQTFQQTSAVDEKGQRQKVALVINAHLIFSDPNHIQVAEDFKLIQDLELFGRNKTPYAVVVWKTKSEQGIPSQLKYLDKLYISHTSHDERKAYSGVRRIAEQLAFENDAFNKNIASSTDGFSLNEVEILLNYLINNKPAHLEDIASQARALKVGISESVWNSVNTNQVIKHLYASLNKQVIGQDHALEQVVNKMIAAAVGLKRAGQGAKVMAPRAILFLAGPTGTGKTETVKALANAIYGQENIVRFDCGELQEAHSLNRLIGSPPGYVGHESGGELTDAVRRQPNSIILFDEIEKANSKIFDMLLGVIDGGRLTSGQGDTTFFGETILAFTSNLGMYEDVVNEYGVHVKKPRFSYETSFETLRTEMVNAITEEFTSKLARPELLGKLGGKDSIIMFDYIRDIKGVTLKFLENIRKFCELEYQIKLSYCNDLISYLISKTQNNPLALNLGARGIMEEINTTLVSPIEVLIFKNPQVETISCTFKNDSIKFDITNKKKYQICN